MVCQLAANWSLHTSRRRDFLLPLKLTRKLSLLNANPGFNHEEHEEHEDFKKYFLKSSCSSCSSWLNPGFAFNRESFLVSLRGSKKSRLLEVWSDQLAANWQTISRKTARYAQSRYTCKI